MGKNRSASGLVNVIQYDDNGNISFVSGSTTLMSVSSSGAITTTGVISGSSVQSASLAQNSNLLQGTGSVGFTTTASFTATSGSASSRLTQIEAVYATTGSNSFRATQSITGSLTVTGQIIAQTINVQQVTSSIVYSSGSNTFGCDLNSRQTFTGSLFITGSNVNINSIGIGIGTSSPCYALHVSRCSVYHITAEQPSTDTNDANAYATFFLINNAGASQVKGYFGAGGNSVNNGAMQNHVYAGAQTNHGFRLFTNDTARVTITNTGIACFACQVCVPNIISTDATNTTLRISCAIVPLSNYRTSDCGYGGIDFFNNGKGYACSAKFYTFKTSTEFYGLTNDYNGSAQLSLIACGAGGGEDIAFFTGTSATPKVVIDNNATCITCQLSVGPSVTIGSQGGTDTTVIGGGSGVGSLIRMNYAGGAFNNYLAGNGDNFFNCLLGKLNAAGGIKFGSGATTLNYYESGTWTPQLYWTGGGNYCMGGINGGNYVRIGNVVSVNYHLQWFGLCGSSGFGGQLRIGGLPFAIGSYRSAGTISAISSGIGRSGANITWHANTVDPGANFIYWIENDPAGGYSHSPSVGATGLVYSNQVTYTLQ